MLLKYLKISIVSLLSACSVTTIPPVEEIGQKTAELPTSKTIKKDVVKKQIITEYHCKNKKRIRIQKSASQKKTTPIIVSFNQASYKLSPQVSRQAKKYSNIRWTWAENMQGMGTLTDNSHKILAEKCVKKGGK